MEPDTRNPKPETRNPKPETRNPKPETLKYLIAPPGPGTAASPERLEGHIRAVHREVGDGAVAGLACRLEPRAGEGRPARNPFITVY